MQLLNNVMCCFISDPTLTTDNVAQVMELVNNWMTLYSISRLRHGALVIDHTIIPYNLLGDIQQKKFSTKQETANACASYYVHCHPESSWIHLARHLYFREQFAALGKLKPFLPLRGKYQLCWFISKALF